MFNNNQNEVEIVKLNDTKRVNRTLSYIKVVVSKWDIEGLYI